MTDNEREYNRERALLFIRQALYLIHPEKGNAQITPSEFLEHVGEFIKSGKHESLGRIGYDLARWRERVEDEFAHAPVRQESV